MQALLVLTVSKFDICRPAVALDGRQGVELSHGVTVAKTSKMTPVDLHLPARWGFKANKGLSLLLGTSEFLQIISNDGDLAVKAVVLEPL